MSNVEEVSRSKERQEILNLLTEQLPEGMSIRQVSEAPGKNYHTTRCLLRKMEAAGDAWEEHDYVFCTTIGKHLHPGHDVLEELTKLLKKAGLPDVRFHDLRHSTATLLLNKGVHPKVVQEILGHSEISMTLDTYSHVLPMMKKAAMEGLNEFFDS